MSVLVLVGPTASGKTSLALDLARALDGEIVNGDSMLVYRGLDIAVAKPTAAERAEVPHHVLDMLDVTENATVADFQARARAAIADVQARERLPILVGGSALYVRAIIDEFDFPGTDARVRARWEARLAEIGPVALHRELAARSPEGAATIDEANGRRTVRALEILELTGSWRPQLPAERAHALPGVRQFGLDIADRAWLDARIEQRVDEMFANGLVEEIRTLDARGLRRGTTAVRAIGVPQVLDLLDGVIDEAEARRSIAAATRRFARRQWGWYRRDPRITWLPAAEPDVLERALAVWRAE